MEGAEVIKPKMKGHKTNKHKKSLIPMSKTYYNLKNEQNSTDKYINFNDAKVIERLQRKQHRMSKGEHHYALNQKKQPQELLEDHSGSEHSDIEPNSKR